eukprot:g26587.t1
MEGFSNSASKQHLLSNNLLSDAQFGFCQGYSAPDLITTLVQTRTKELNSRGDVRVTALDIKAAFNKKCGISSSSKTGNYGNPVANSLVVRAIPDTYKDTKMLVVVG